MDQKIDIEPSLLHKLFFKIKNPTEVPSECWFDEIVETIYNRMEWDEDFVPSFKRSQAYFKLLQELDLVNQSQGEEDVLSLNSLENLDPEPHLHESCSAKNLQTMDNLLTVDGEKSMKHFRSLSDVTDIKAADKRDFIYEDVIKEHQSIGVRSEMNNTNFNATSLGINQNSKDIINPTLSSNMLQASNTSIKNSSTNTNNSNTTINLSTTNNSNATFNSKNSNAPVKNSNAPTENSVRKSENLDKMNSRNLQEKSDKTNPGLDPKLREKELKSGDFVLTVHFIETGIVCDKGKTFGIYAIQVSRQFASGSLEQWHIYRRYSDFYDLYSKVKDKFPDLSKIAFPGKKTFHNMERSVLEKRMKMLGSYMHELCQPNVVNSHHGLKDLLMSFLEQGDYDKATSGGPISHTIDTIVNPLKSGMKTIKNMPEQFINTVDEVVEGLNKVFHSKAGKTLEASKVSAGIDIEVTRLFYIVFM